MKKDYCTQNKGNCETCSLVNYGLNCRNNPIAQPKTEKRLRGRDAAMKSYTGHHGPVTIAAVESSIPVDLRGRLTGHEYGLTMSAVNSSYHKGKADAGAELIDGDMVWCGDKGWPLAILKELSTEVLRVTTWEPTTRSCSRGGNNDKYVQREGEYVRLATWEVEGCKEQLYYRNNDTHTVVKYRGIEIDRLPYYV